MTYNKMTYDSAFDGQFQHEGDRSRTFSGTVAVLAFVVVSFLGGVTNASAQPNVKDFPLAIVCERDDEAIIGHLHKFDKDGNAIYMSVDGRRALRTVEGKFENLPGVNLKGTCVGKTIQELRAEGMTVDAVK